MKKRLFYIIIIILLLTSICVWEQITVNTCLTEMYELSSSLQQETKEATIVKTDELLQKVNKIDTVWTNYEEQLCFVVNHKDISEMAIEISKLKANVVADQVEDFKSGISYIVHLSQTYNHVMGISIQNLL